MSRSTVLAAGRKAAEAGMVDACTITRKVGTSTNPETAVVVDNEVQLYSGKCRVQSWSVLGGTAQPRTIGAQFVRLLRVELQLPITGTEGLQSDDIVTITAATHDSDLVGRRYTVRDLSHHSEKTARRIGINEVV